MIIASFILNLLVVFFFAVACMTFTAELRRKQEPVKEQFRIACRYFTVQSNIFAAAVCLIAAFYDLAILLHAADTFPMVLAVLKLIATTGVMLTFLVVLCYLLPHFGMTDLFQGANFYMHLVTPLLSLASFLFFEGPYRIPVPFFFLSVIPVAAYGVLYVCRVIYTKSPQKRWDDMYEFNSGGNWRKILALMFALTAAISAALGFLHNLILA